MSLSARSCMDRLSAVSPANHLAQMSWVYCGATLESTLITPLPPSASRGTIWSSLPEVDVQAVTAGGGNLGHLTDVAAGLFTALMFRCLASSARVAGSGCSRCGWAHCRGCRADAPRPQWPCNGQSGPPDWFCCSRASPATARQHRQPRPAGTARWHTWYRWSQCLQ